MKAIFRKIPASEGALIAFVFLLALGLRLWNIGASSLWIDEIYSFMVANGHLPPTHLDGLPQPAAFYYQHYLAWQPLHFPTLLALLKINVHLPLYYLLLNPWLGVFGADTVGLRSFSALFSALTVFPLYGLGKAIGGRRAGLLAACVAALAPFQLYYGQEGRMYALSLFCAAFSALAFWKTLYSRHPLRWSLLYALSVVAGVMSHYIFVFFLGFQAAYAALWFWKGLRQKATPTETLPPLEPRRIWLFGFAIAALAVAGIWWYPVYLAQQQGINEEYHFAKGLVNPLRYLTSLVWQPLVVVAGDNPLERVFYIPLTVALSAFFLLSRLFAKARASVSNPMEPLRFQREGFVLLWIFVPLFLQIGYDVLKHTHTSVIERYALLISPAMCLWLGLTLDSLFDVFRTTHRNAPLSLPNTGLSITSKGAKLGTGLLIVMLLLAVLNVWNPSPFRDEHNKDKNIRAKIHYMAQHARPDDLVFANGPFGAPLIAAYYLLREPSRSGAGNPHSAKIPPAQIPIVYWISDYYGQHPDLPSGTLFAGYPRVWLFRYRANNERGLQQAKDALSARYPHLDQPRDWFLYSRLP
jgi:uncharacterized membrane protein